MDGIDQAPGIRPKPSLGRRLDLIARGSFPTAATVVLMLLACVLGVASHLPLLPAVAFGSVYFWSTSQPTCMPPQAVFVLGLLLDLLGYLPLGVGPVSLLLVHGVAVRWSRLLRRQRFLLTWLAFGGLAASAGGLGWALVSLLSVRLMPTGAALFQIIVTVALYPTIAALFSRRSRTDIDQS